MKSHLIMTVLGTDRTGLVNCIADIVAKHGGNWLDSRMVRMAGQFAGVIRVECPTHEVSLLLQEIRNPGIPGLTVQAAREGAPSEAKLRTLSVDVIGQDRPGIVRELTAAIAGAGANVEELATGLESAPMTGMPMFRARGIISIPEQVEADSVTAAIEDLGGDLTVDISL